MNGNPLSSRRLRTAFDWILITLLLLFTIANFLTVQASSEARPSVWESKVADPISFSGLDPASDNPSRNLSTLDDTTSAAIIAAENAALTLSQYFINLPAFMR